jgi:DNA gyrase subunit A
MTETEQFLHELEAIPLAKIVKEEYRNYQIYTLMDRAIPYLQDGLKPGQRRILFTLWKNQSKGLIKVSAATGLVLTLHPHGPASIESAIVNLAQDYTFSNNYPLIDKKGYFGERMETAPAAGRYIECKIGEVAKFLLFDDLNQVEMVPNYDEKVMEPACLLPKLPLMLLNGAEGIGTGFSSVIPSFHHRDLIRSVKTYLETGKARKLKPFVHNYSEKIIEEKSGRLTFPMRIEKIKDKIFITELPRGFDAVKVYKYLGKHMDNGFLKDFIDSSVNNEVNIELIFKRGQQPSLSEVEDKMLSVTNVTPNYTLISENGVRIFNGPEEIIEIFGKERLKVVQRRYELLAIDLEDKIKLNNEVIRFIKKKEYEVATKKKNRKEFVGYLKKQKYHFVDYLADMPIYRMTKEEVQKRKLLVAEETDRLKKYKKTAKSKSLIKKALLNELNEVSDHLDNWLKKREQENKKLQKVLDRKSRKSKKRQ